MKKSIIKIVSVFWVLITVILTFAGCRFGRWGAWGGTNHIFPDGYTCGMLRSTGSPVEYWWVETYEECVDAIELLKSHGSTFSDDVVLACDENLFDVKYCFQIAGDGRNGERIRFGDNPFDRWAYDVKIYTYAFFDDVTIDELVYSYASRYETYLICFESAYQLMFDESFDIANLKISDWVMFTGYSSSKLDNPYRTVSYGEQSVLCVQTLFYVSYEEKDTIQFKMTDECIDYIINSVRIIETNK